MTRKDGHRATLEPLFQAGVTDADAIAHGQEEYAHDALDARAPRPGRSHGCTPERFAALEAYGERRWQYLDTTVAVFDCEARYRASGQIVTDERSDPTTDFERQMFEPRSGDERITALRVVLSSKQPAKIDGVFVEHHWARMILELYDEVGSSAKKELAETPVPRIPQLIEAWSRAWPRD